MATDSPDTSWWNSGDSARRLGITVRHLYRLVDCGIVPPPTRLGYRNHWSETDLSVAESRRKEHTQPRRPSGASRGIERKRDGAELARAFWACWKSAGLQTAITLVRAEGAEHPGKLPRGVHQRLSYALHRAADLGRVLPPP